MRPPPHRDAQGLALDELLPPGVNAFLPNLRIVSVHHCALLPTARATQLDAAAYGALQLVQVEALSLVVETSRLHLHDAYRRWERGTWTPAPAWRATLQQVAQCTRLRLLTIPCTTAEELRLVAPALQGLRDLHLNSILPVDADGDAVVDVLLGLPQLTGLRWESCGYAFRRWHSDARRRRAGCRWARLAFRSVLANVLARLPLHTLAEPLRWSMLQVRR